MLSVVLVIALGLGGFLVTPTPSHYEWFQTINFFSYALTAMTLNEFAGLVLVDEQGQQVDALAALRQTGRIRNNLSLWGNVGVLVGMLLLFRVVAYVLLSRKVRPSRFKKVELARVALATTPTQATTSLPAAVP